MSGPVFNVAGTRVGVHLLPPTSSGSIGVGPTTSLLGNEPGEVCVRTYVHT